MPERLVIMCDVSYKPLEVWAENWNRPVSTIKSWIYAGTCPAKKIGGQWMISQMELLNWTPPEEETRVESEPVPNVKSKGRRNVRAAKDGQAVSARESGGREKARWPV